MEIIILEIQTKYIDDKNVIETEIDSQKQRIELLEKNNFDQEKKDMWDDQNFLNGVVIQRRQTKICFLKKCEKSIKKLNFSRVWRISLCSNYCSKKNNFIINKSQQIILNRITFNVLFTVLNKISNLLIIFQANHYLTKKNSKK